MTEVGAAGAVGDRPGGYYTQAELADLVAYAAERFVTLVPEIDMPGHTAAVFRAYPELAPAEIRSIDLGNGTSIELGTLDPDRAETWAFVEDVLDAVIPQFPQSAYVHIGGDEAWGMPDEAHAAFVERAAELVRARGKKVVGWQEIARAAISSDDVVQYWLEPRQLDALNGAADAASTLPPDLLPMLVEHLTKAAQDVPRALAHGSRLLSPRPVACTSTARTRTRHPTLRKRNSQTRRPALLHPGLDPHRRRLGPRRRNLRSERRRPDRRRRSSHLVRNHRHQRRTRVHAPPPPPRSRRKGLVPANPHRLARLRHPPSPPIHPLAPPQLDLVQVHRNQLVLAVVTSNTSEGHAGQRLVPPVGELSRWRSGRPVGAVVVATVARVADDQVEHADAGQVDVDLLRVSSRVSDAAVEQHLAVTDHLERRRPALRADVAHRVVDPDGPGQPGAGLPQVVADLRRRRDADPVGYVVPTS